MIRASSSVQDMEQAALKQGRRWVIDEDARFVGMVGSVDISSSLSDKARQLVEKAINGSSPQKT